MTVDLNPKVIGLPRFLAQLLAAAETGQCLLSADGNVLLANPRAQNVLDQRDGIALDSEHKLVIDTPRDAARWLEIMQEGSGRMLITRLSGAHPYRAHLFPLDAEEIGLPGYRYLLVLHDPASAPVHSIQALRELYRLTEAETEVLEALAAGKSVEEIAEQRGNAPATVRTQLKALYRKTHTSRQAELLRLVLPAA
jgi:DNA-binding CsgD family transcriptional regulator